MPATSLFALLGLLVGVLVNRFADNLPPPARLSVLDTPRCPYCGTVRGLREQSGLGAFLFSGGRCRQCRAPLPLRAPIVELLTALLFAILWTRLGPGLAVIEYGLAAAVLLLITVIDMEHRLILNVVVLPATLLALLFDPGGLLTSLPLYQSARLVLIPRLLGALCGYFLVYAIYLFGALFARLMARVRGRALDEVAFGMGDVKLAGLVGALVGLPSIFQALVYAILLGGLGSAIVILFQRLVRGNYSAFMAIPYGPFFTIVTWLLLLRSL